jgi:hypothetical protein
MKRVRQVLFGVVVGWMTLGSPLGAQTIRGTLTGTVTDSTGAILPGITVTVTHRDTNISAHALTNASGNYTFPLLAPGEYAVVVEQTGFKKHVRAGVVVQIAQATRVDIPLQVGDMAETLQVVAESPLVRSTTAELGHVIEMKQIQALPLNGRLFQSLIGLTPGTVARSGGDGAENPAAGGARGNTQHTVNGMPWSGNNFLLDGVANNEPLNSLVNISPPLEAIQEFKVQTVNPTAEFGVFGGASVNLTIRSGTNTVHGSVFEYFRDDSMNKKTFFATTKEPLTSHQFGGTLGGPILRDKAFFFVDYQRLQQDQASFRTMSVPTLKMRAGDLSEIAEPIFDPASGQEFAGRIIPTNRINPIARRAAEVWPEPNGTGIANNYSENVVNEQRLNAGDLRLDYHFNERSSAFFRASMAARTFDEGTFGNVFMGGNNSESDNYNAVLGYTRAFGADKFYELRIGYNRFDVEQHGEDFGIDKSNELGILNGNIAAFPNTSGITRFNVPGFAQTASAGFTNSQRFASTLHLTNNLSWMRDKHTIKAGADVRLMRSTLTNPELHPRGVFNFDRLYTSRAGAAGTGHPWASFLLGLPTGVDRGFVDTLPQVRRNFVGLFLQDDFRVSRKLSLQLGLRWDLMTPPVDAHNRQSNFSLEDGLIHVATDDNRGPNLDTHWDYFAPRLGFAYTPDNGKTAVRGAFGISYFPDNFGANGGTNERNYPFFQGIQIRSNLASQNTPFRSLDEGLPGFTPVPLADRLTPPAGFAVFYIPRTFHEDTVKMFNLGVQRELGWNTMAEATVVRTIGTNLFVSRNINVPLPGPGAQAPRRPYASIAANIPAINERDSDGKSWYSALQFKLDKRFSGGLQALLSYTLSKTEDTLNIIHPAFEFRLPATSKTVDIPHNLSLSFTYELPFKGHALVQGWSITGISSYQSGDPLDIRVATSRLNTGTANWADVTCGTIGMPKAVSATDATARWFDTGCFAEPAEFEFGNYKVGDVRGPHIFNTDMSIFKRTMFGKKSVELRADVFNVLNRAHFANPPAANLNVGNAQFGRVIGTRLPAREVQLGLRFLF